MQKKGQVHTTKYNTSAIQTSCEPLKKPGKMQEIWIPLTNQEVKQGIANKNRVKKSLGQYEKAVNKHKKQLLKMASSRNILQQSNIV